MERIRASHILVQHQHEIEDIQKKLQEGEPFSDLAQKFSQCPSSNQGGDLGFFTKGQMVEEFEAAAFALAPSEVSGPVRTSFGFHLIQRTE